MYSPLSRKNSCTTITCTTEVFSSKKNNQKSNASLMSQKCIDIFKEEEREIMLKRKIKKICPEYHNSKRHSNKTV